MYDIYFYFKGVKVLLTFPFLRRAMPIILVLFLFLIISSNTIKTSSTYIIKTHVGKTVSSNITKMYIRDQVKLTVPSITQFPELPRGCEVTSLAMLLRYKGVNVDKLTLAEEIDKVPYYEEGIYGNPEDGFVGNMYTYNEPGLSVYNKPIEELARKYLSDNIINLTGSSFDTIKEQLSKGNPVWVIVGSTFTFLPNENWETWKTSSKEIKISRKVHSVLITGYDNQFVYFNDPFYSDPNRSAKLNDFVQSWTQFGIQAISYID